ncbi:hypothetical protein P691DRAFT_800662 [Macrolepiota fuliginosa MF-IS2]|uniref:Uncharacterized protein n=1 Tax=Macrolepiota fuliginosa MF-IS2 TaxID=1400762 RepID=A0A9P6BX08_9AGAR|nr:hypothetical protein P691DRAFT_800662 [Macrolepiota fuliginosa MF-IS2]
MERGIRAVNVCFITSRLWVGSDCSVIYILNITRPVAVPVGNCDLIYIISGCFCILSISSSSFLFLRRVQAVYADNRWVQWFFFILWLVYCGLEFTVPIGTRHCIDSETSHYVLAGAFSPIIFDTLVFLAISFKVGSSHTTQDTRVTRDTLVSGKALPRLSRAVLQGGQQYYLITAGSVSVIPGVILCLPSTSPMYRNMFAYPEVALAASMAYRVYRNIKLFDRKVELSQLPVSSLHFVGEYHE